jgi:hypothetical protein
MTLQELMNKRAKAWEAAKAFLDSHRNTDGLLSQEDGETYDRMEKEITDYTKEIDRLLNPVFQNEITHWNHLSQSST